MAEGSEGDVDSEPTIRAPVTAMLLVGLAYTGFLADPRTGRQTALSEMSARSLDRALDALEGKAVPEKSKRLTGLTRSYRILPRQSWRQSHGYRQLKSCVILFILSKTRHFSPRHV